MWGTRGGGGILRQWGISKIAAKVRKNFGICKFSGKEKLRKRDFCRNTIPTNTKKNLFEAENQLASPRPGIQRKILSDDIRHNRRRVFMSGHNPDEIDEESFIRHI